MTSNFKEAISGYLEFNLVKFIEQFEGQLDPDAVGAFYEEAYRILNDMEDAIQTSIDLNEPPKPIKQR